MDMETTTNGVLAYHVIFGTYGFWLPNDPRGSWSDFVGAWELFLAGGKATTTNTRHSVAGKQHDSEARLRAKQALKYPPVIFDGHQALSVAHGFGRMIAKSKYVVHACAILPTHVHLVIARHSYKVEQIVRLLKGEASRELESAGRHPLAEFAADDGSLPSPWARKCWKVFLDSEDRVRVAVKYVEDNPLREGKRKQTWSFVTPV